MATPRPQEPARHETTTLISADKVEGTSVKNRKGDSLGSIDTVMIDKFSGKVAYAVMSFGGFLGIGDRYHPLPWDVLRYEPKESAYVVDIDKTTLEKAPSLARDEYATMQDRDWGERVYRYYNVPPYWI
jgi:PRC-barrel domain